MKMEMEMEFARDFVPVSATHASASECTGNACSTYRLTEKVQVR